MKKLLIATILVAVVMLAGCLSALHPLFTESDLAFDPKLVGSWRVGADEEIYKFERGTPQSFASLPEGLQKLSGKAYLLTISARSGEEGKKYYAFLARIGKHLYLDYFPAETDDQKGYADFYKQGFLPMHTFYRVRPGSNSDTMKIGQFGENYLRNLIDKKKIRIRHEVRIDGSYVITAPTEELQQYVIKYSDVDEAYEDNKTFARIK
jgi:hypothetical protein